MAETPLALMQLVTAPRLELLLDQLRDYGHRQITVDLSQLTFLGAAGLNVVIRADPALRSTGGRLLLTKPTLTGLDTSLTIPMTTGSYSAHPRHLRGTAEPPSLGDHNWPQVGGRNRRSRPLRMA